MRRKTILVILFLCFEYIGISQNEKCEIVTKDVIHFWEAIDSVKENCDTTQIFQKFFIDRATKEFKAFISQRKITASNYTKQYRQYPSFYKTLRKSSMKLIQNERYTEATIEKFRKIYPNFNEATICVSMGNFSTGGTISISQKDNQFYDKLVFISLEFHGLDAETTISELPVSIQAYVSRSNFYRTIIHELVHIQQETHGKKISKVYAGKDLSTKILREGIPDFIGKLVYPDGNDGNNYAYGLQHEETLKEKLKNEMYSDDFSYWMYNANIPTLQPKDLGYFMGSKIAAGYYKQMLKNEEDVTSLIEIKSTKDFIRKSNYFNQ